MKFEINIEDQRRSVPIVVAANTTVRELIDQIETEANIDGLSIIEMALESDASLDDAITIDTLRFKHDHFQVHRVCVEVYVEGEPARHHFPITARWAHVHRWACRKFTVAPDACANLEMHLGKIDGPLVNERKAIGHHEGCVEVWLVKPGPEPNGNLLCDAFDR
jgi:hypothetical protein